MYIGRLNQYSATIIQVNYCVQHHPIIKHTRARHVVFSRFKANDPLQPFTYPEHEYLSMRIMASQSPLKFILGTHYVGNNLFPQFPTELF